MNKKLLFFTLLLLLVACCSTIGCTESKLNFDDLVITVSDLNDVRAGDFSVRYYIENLDAYQSELGVTISVSCVNEEGERVAVTNNRALLENNSVYHFTVTAQTAEKSKQATYTVVTERTIMTLTFSSGDYKNFSEFTRTVTYGQTLADVPEVPELEVSDTETLIRRVSGKTWSRLDFSDIRKDETVYAKYTVEETLRQFTVTFDAMGGECSTAEKVYTYNTDFGTDVPIPISDEGTFFSWYYDDTLKHRVTADDLITADVTVYAKYVTEDADVSPLSLFSFRPYPNFGLAYAVSAAVQCTANSGEGDKRLPTTLVIPKLYNGRPVVAVDQAGFQFHSEVQTLVIPETIIEIAPHAFSSCTGLTSVDIRTSDVTYLGIGMFSDCTSLKSINVPSSVTNIADKAFYGCTDLASVTFEEGGQLIRIGKEAFFGCTALSSLRFAFEVPPIVEEYAFYRRNAVTNEKELSDTTLYVPVALLPIYSAEYGNVVVKHIEGE